MPQSLAIYEPRDIGEGVAVVEQRGDEAKVIAGGTALSLMLRQRLIAPEALVSIGRLPGLAEIAVDGADLRLGALASHRSVELSPLVRERLPVLADVFGKVANVRVRNAATVGGVLAEADYASDPPAVFVGLDAIVEAAGPNGQRTIPATEFFQAFYETALEPTEIVTGVRVPLPEAGQGAVYEKFVTRSSEDRPCIGVFAACRRAGDGTFGDVRIVVGAAAETPQRYADLEASVAGTDLAEDVCRQVADGYAERVETLDDMRGSAWYRTEMVKVWVRRALVAARDAAAAV
jgi:carbon-monoxide dehydrogenase medium subunit